MDLIDPDLSDEILEEQFGPEPVYDPRLDGVIERLAAEEQAGVEAAWAERMQEVRALAEQHPELRDPEVLEAVAAQADALAQQAGLDDVDAAFFVTDPGTISAALATVTTGIDPAEAYGQTAWEEIRAAGAGAIDPEEHRRHEIESLQKEAESLRAEARNARRDHRKGAGADAMEERAERLEAQARERATSRSSLAFEDEAPTLVLSGTGEASLPESEPTHEERITEAIEFDGGDPNDYGDRTWAEIEAVDSGDPFR
jgi:hypothetical protein